MDHKKEQRLRLRLARNLRRLRLSHSPCLSQKALAKKLGVTQKSISRYENALCLPPAHVLIALAEEFGLTTDALFMEPLRLNNSKKKEGTRTNEDITHSDPQEDRRREREADG